MPLVNSNNFLYLNSEPNELAIWRKASANLELLKAMDIWDFNKLSYYIEVKNKFAMKNLQTFIPKIVQEILQTGGMTLIINNAHEAFHSLVEPLYYDFIIPLNINEDNIILVSESFDIKHQIQNLAKETGRKPIRAIWTRIFEYNVSAQINKQIKDGKTFPTLHYKPYVKKFINFNRRWRTNRPCIVGALAVRGLIDQGYVSLAGGVDGKNWENSWDQLLRLHPTDKFPYIGNLLRDHADQIRSIPSLLLDTEELLENKATLLRSTDQYYQNTYFSLVTETNFYISIQGEEPGRFFSEKTFKPIAERHPFILVNPPYSLSKLRDLGYQTFNPFINEDYDMELDDDKRLQMILDEVERLCNLDEQQLEQFLVGTASICDHNQQVLRTKALKDFSEMLDA